MLAKIKYGISYLFLVIIGVSCVPENVVKEYNSRIVLAGEIENLTDSTIQLFKQVSPVEWKLVEKITSNNGSFNYQLTDSNANYYRLINNNHEWNLFLTPKDSVYMTFNSSDPYHTVRLKGKRGRNENNYMNAKDFFVKNKLITDTLFLQSEKEFHKEIKYIKKQFLFALNEANVNNQDFRRDERIAIDYFIGKLLFLYPRINPQIKENQIALSDDYYEFLEVLAVENTDFIDISEYIDFMSNVILYKYSDSKGDKTIDEITREYFKNPENIKKIKKILI